MWMLTLGPTFFHDPIVIPFVNIMTSLGLFVGALFVGVIIKYFLPKVAKFICKYHKGFSIIYVLYITTVGVYVNLYAFEYLKHVKILLSGMLLPWTGTFISGVLAFFCRQSWARVKTIAIETAMQNAAISLILLDRCFDEPEADISSVMPIAALLFTPLPLLVAVGVKYYREDRCFWQKPSTYDITKDEKDTPDTVDMEMTENGISNPLPPEVIENGISVVNVMPVKASLGFPPDYEDKPRALTADSDTMASSFHAESNFTPSFHSNSNFPDDYEEEPVEFTDDKVTLAASFPPESNF